MRRLLSSPAGSLARLETAFSAAVFAVFLILLMYAGGQHGTLRDDITTACLFLGTLVTGAVLLSGGPRVSDE